ncbi:hypothetical protein C1645_831219 [Glomus cerebriforme]|uniref:Mug135-like C-terminal domain-containing protein n=1 Tax=Glomus cerebriforme TaxID=658196 RepID=A0A397SQM7_9GLOM|nr:hypothetical protein C1645_831219 [Glomus cerebriforme]
MAFNLPTYVGNQPSHPTNIPQNITPNNPTDNEYARAVLYTAEVVNRYQFGDANDTDVASASDFMFQVGNVRLLALQPGTLQGAPAWANQLQQNINQFQQNMHQGFNQLQQNFHQRFNHLEINTAKAYNASCGDGMSRPWIVVKDGNGVDPTIPPNNLPPLYNRNVITGLNNNATNAYIAFYQINVPANATIARKKTEIAGYLGASFVGISF